MVDLVMVGLVRDELRRSTDRGELASRESLQAVCGMGARDLQVALDVLREQGEISEVEPNGFRLSEEDGEEMIVMSADKDGRRVSEKVVQQIPSERMAFGSSPPQVSMPRAVATVLDAAALGALLIAGIETTGAGETFVFEVTP